jgi:hypothetical protein
MQPDLFSNLQRSLESLLTCNFRIMRKELLKAQSQCILNRIAWRYYPSALP